MLVVTTTMFALGLAALVLQTSLAYQQFTLTFNPSSTSLWSPRYTDVITAVGAIIACIIVRSPFFPTPPSVHSVGADSPPPPNAPPGGSLDGSVAVTKYILSDVVGAWRAAVLWNYNRKVVAVLTLFVLGTTGELAYLVMP